MEAEVSFYPSWADEQIPWFYWAFVKCFGVNNKEAYLNWIKNEKFLIQF